MKPESIIGSLTTAVATFVAGTLLQGAAVPMAFIGAVLIGIVYAVADAQMG